MSTFYGMIQGNRGAATRGGSHASGFRASAQSWNGSVIVDLDYNDKEQLMVRVGVSNGSSSCEDWDTPNFRGTFEEFKELLQLHKDLKSGKVSIISSEVK